MYENELMVFTTPKSVWVAGEVLIDLIATGSQTNAVVGGGPANTAVALSRLGIDAYFIDGMSSNEYGQRAKEELIAAGVKLDFVEFSSKPMCIAKVMLNAAGSATYEFLIEGTATFDFRQEWLPDPTLKSPTVLYLGTLAAVVELGASELFAWAKRVSHVAPIVYDPNVRSSVLSDPIRYRESVARWISISKVVKLSEDDCAWLYPDELFEDIAKGWIESGVELAILTRGGEGITAKTAAGEIAVPGVRITVVDTVGAGDTVGAILVEAIVNRGLSSLIGDELRRVLVRATRAAAITCSRSGAQPPTSEELAIADQ